MKYFVVFAMCVAAASAFAIPPIVAAENAAQIQEIIDAIYHPSTDPATAAALEQMLQDILAVATPDPAIIPPNLVDESFIPPIAVLPEIIDSSIVSEPANWQPSPPVVQIIINVKPNVPGNPVVVEQPSQIVPTPVVVVDQPEIQPDDVSVVEQPTEVAPEPVIVAPILPTPVVTLPGILN